MLAPYFDTLPDEYLLRNLENTLKGFHLLRNLENTLEGFLNYAESAWISFFEDEVQLPKRNPECITCRKMSACTGLLPLQRSKGLAVPHQWMIAKKGLACGYVGGGCRQSGVTDYYAKDDAHALHLARRVVKNLNRIKDPGVRLCLSAFGTAEWGPCSSRLCSRCLWNEALVLQTLLLEWGPRSSWLSSCHPRNEALIPWTLLWLAWKT